MAVRVPVQPSQPLDSRREAGLLAESLRSSRLTTLYGPPGSGKSALLHHGVLPLLHRRASDLAVPQDLVLRGVVPFPDRRRAVHGRSPEIALCFDDWLGKAPLERLLAQIHEATGIATPEPGAAESSAVLASTLAALDMRFGVRFLILLDGFEQCLDAATERTEIQDFLAALTQALKRPQLPANFLIALRSDARPQLQAFLTLVPGLGDNVVHLPAAPAQRPPPVLHQVPTAAAPEPAPASTERDEDWLSSIDVIMHRVSAVARDEAPPDRPEAPAALTAAAATPAPPPKPKPAPAPAPASVTAPPASVAAPATAAHASPRGPRLWLALPVLALAVLAYAVWRADRPTAPVALPRAAPAPVQAAPAASAAPVPRPAAIGIDERPGTLAELTLALAPGAERSVPAWPPGFDAVPGQPGLALARYDALQALRRSGSALPLQVVAPLYTEPMLFIARADSPLVFIHDIEGARIHAGPAGSGRALSAAAIYQRMFGKPLAAPAADSGDAALGRLLRNDGVDVLVLSGPQLEQLWSALPAATARALKPLQRSDTHPADQRALQAYLPATLLGTPSFAVMNFLVADSGPAATSAAQALCTALPELKRNGNPKWRELQPGLQLATGWPSPADAQQAWRACTAGGR